MEIRKLHDRRRPVTTDTDFGRIAIGRGANRAQESASELVYNQHLARLEAVRLTGYRYLKPPGSSKTLKNIQEEEAWNRMTASGISSATSANMERSFISRGSGFSEDGELDTAVTDAEILRSDENVHYDHDSGEEAMDDEGEDEDQVDFTPNLSFPTMDASLPSAYHSGNHYNNHNFD